MKVLFIVPYPLKRAASQRFRFEQYFPELKKRQIEYHISAFFSEKDWQILYSKGNLLLKILALIKGFLRRLYTLVSVAKYDFVFIHREGIPVGPPVYEWIIAKVFRKKIIYDFDDAIWIPNFSEHNSIMYYLKWYSNTRLLCKWAYKVSCGNEYLCDFARKYNSNVVYNPTTIDTLHVHNRLKDQNSDDFVVGWTGSHSTIRYLDELIPVFTQLENFPDIKFIVISDKAPAFKIRNLEFIPWRKETEIQDLLKMNVGLMPLKSDKWAEGKCGFKALQYNALGIPALVSPVGVNKRIVKDGLNGYICSTAEEWESAILHLYNDRNKLKEMGPVCRDFIEKEFSVLPTPITSSLCSVSEFS